MALYASTRRLGRSLRHETVIGDRHEIATDEPVRLGGDDTAPAPHELLPAALASCVSTTVAMYASRKGWDIDGIEVDVAYDHEADPRRFSIEVRLPDDLTPEQVERLRRVAASCPVHRALEDGFRFDQRLIRVPRVREAGAA